MVEMHEPETKFNLESPGGLVKVKAQCIYIRTVSSLLWQYGLWSFQTGDTKLERFWPKNQHTQMKFLNCENWTNREPQ